MELKPTKVSCSVMESDLEVISLNWMEEMATGWEESVVNYFHFVIGQNLYSIQGVPEECWI